MYQRIGAAAFKKDLTNTLALCEALGQPQKLFKSVHVAGTNGKGSCSHMLASVLQSAGYKTGLYTSPHLKSFTERIKINGREVPERFVIDFVNKLQPVIERVRPSFFETTVAMAFDYFASEKVDIAVIEVGLGGRLDSTNVIVPEISLITNIGYDHMDMLGDTLEKIAAEKAGIIKHGIPVVISQRQPETTAVFLNKAQELQAPVFFAQDNFAITEGLSGLQLYRNGVLYIDNLDLPLKGAYQKKNLAGVVNVLEILATHGFNIPASVIKMGLEATLTQTGLKGRWQKLGERPLIICDTGHNKEGIQEVLNEINRQKFNRLFMVIGMVSDKDHDSVLELLPRQATYFFCQANIPRALPAAQLAGKAARYGLTGCVIPDVNQCIDAAKQQAGPDDFIFIGGSTFVVAEINDL